MREKKEEEEEEERSGASGEQWKSVFVWPGVKILSAKWIKWRANLLSAKASATVTGTIGSGIRWHFQRGRGLKGGRWRGGRWRGGEAEGEEKEAESRWVSEWVTMTATRATQGQARNMRICLVWRSWGLGGHLLSHLLVNFQSLFIRATHCKAGR